MIQFEETPLPTFTLIKIEKGVKVYPGIKDLPVHIRQNFRNEFIRFAISSCSPVFINVVLSSRKDL